MWIIDRQRKVRIGARYSSSGGKQVEPHWAPVTELRRMTHVFAAFCPSPLLILILMSSHNCHVLNAYRAAYAYVLASDPSQAFPCRFRIRRPMAVFFGWNGVY
jgi:hypothetical protein